MSQTKVDDQVWILQKSCNQYAAENYDNKSIWIVYAVNYYINTGRASFDWLQRFTELSSEQINTIVLKIMRKNELSDVMIIKQINRFIKYKAVS